MIKRSKLHSIINTVIRKTKTQFGKKSLNVTRTVTLLPTSELTLLQLFDTSYKPIH